MALITLDKKQQSILYVGTFVVVGLSALFLRPFLTLILFAAIMATLFMPVYMFFMRKGKSSGTSAMYTFLISLLAVLIPVVFVVIITVFQLNNLVSAISSGTYTVDITELSTDFVSYVNGLSERFGLSVNLTVDDVTSSVTSFLTNFSKTVFDAIVNSFAGLFSAVTGAIIYIYVFVSMLRHKDKIIDVIKKLNPLGDEVTHLYIDRASAMTKATVRGQFIIAFMQGSISALVVTIFGPDNLFFFLLFLLTLFSVIPLGAGILTIPLGVISMFTGNIIGGAIIIANHLLIVTNIDNIMRPRLVPLSARLDPALMILAVFSGIALFGFLGIVVGPVIMILIVTTLQIYQEVFYKKESIDRRKHSTKTARASLTDLAEKTSAAVNKMFD